jgi:4-hydroxybenzoate polyprenyltransferase
VDDTDGAAAPTSTRRVAVALAVLSVAAVTAAFLAPPLGAVLGVVAVVRAVLARALVPRRTRLVAIAAGVVAVVVGLTITAAALLLREEITEYSRCMQAANTVQAQQNCQDALNSSLSSRLGL